MNGRKIYKRETVDTKKEAEIREEELLKKYQKSTEQMIEDRFNEFLKEEEPNSIEFKKAATQWLRTHKLQVRRSTHDGYKPIVKANLIPYFSGRDIAEIKKVDIEECLYYKSEVQLKPLSGTTLRNHHTVLGMILKENDNYSIEKVKKPKKSNYEPDPITKIDELEKFIESIKHVIAYLPCYIASITGMRHSEIAGLRWKDIDFEQGKIKVRRSLHWAYGDEGRYFYEETTKTKQSKRDILISKKAVDKLKKIKKERQDTEGDFVCIDSNNNPIFKDNTNDSLRRQARKQGYSKLTFHDLRHSHATISIQELGVSPKTVQERLGHSDVSTTLSIYTASSEEQDRKVAGIFDY